MVIDKWMIKNVPPEARRLIKTYAAKHDMPIGEALLKMAKEVVNEN